MVIKIIDKIDLENVMILIRAILFSIYCSLSGKQGQRFNLRIFSPTPIYTCLEVSYVSSIYEFIWSYLCVVLLRWDVVQNKSRLHNSMMNTNYSPMRSSTPVIWKRKLQVQHKTTHILMILGLKTSRGSLIAPSNIILPSTFNQER